MKQFAQENTKILLGFLAVCLIFGAFNVVNNPKPKVSDKVTIEQALKMLEKAMAEDPSSWSCPDPNAKPQQDI
jgi:hypothetical protein